MNISTANQKNLFFKLNRRAKYYTKNIDLYLMLLLPLMYFVIFHYIPMYGVIIAFKKFIPAMGIIQSPWIGLQNFIDFFNSINFFTTIKNTIGISLYQLIAGFPVPIFLALMLNDLRNQKYKKFIQTVTYAPHFISVVVMSGMIIAFLSPSSGIVNNIIEYLGFKPIPFMQSSQWFKTIFVYSGIWQQMGWSSIIYIAALAGLDIEQQEAAIIDGANKIQRIFYLNIPHLLPTIVILLILNLGSIMSVGFEKVFLLQNSLNMESSDVISTYVYRVGLLGGRYSFASAVGLFNSLINFILLVAVNYICRKLNETSLW